MKKLFIILAIACLVVAAAAVASVIALDGLPVGIANGKLVILSQYCSDYCPGYNHSLSSWRRYGFRKYYGVGTEDACRAIGGVPLWGYGWGKRFIGCAPQ